MNAWCNYTHLGQCSFAGVYQPSLPDTMGPYGNFFLIGAYDHIWQALGLPATTTLRALRAASVGVCSLDSAGLAERYHVKHEHLLGRTGHGDIDIGNETTKALSAAQQACFLSAYAFALLRHGHGIELDRNLTAAGPWSMPGPPSRSEV